MFTDFVELVAQVMCSTSEVCRTFFASNAPGRDAGRVQWQALADFGHQTCIWQTGDRHNTDLMGQRLAGRQAEL